MKAVFVKMVHEGNYPEQKLWKISCKCGEYVRFIVSSAATVLGKPEVYLFEATEDGLITNWCELSGSLKGTLDHEKAIKEAGWEIVYE